MTISLIVGIETDTNYRIMPWTSLRYFGSMLGFSKIGHNVISSVVVMNPLITIVTPVFNGVKYVAQCIHSVAAQVRPGIEHLIVDGGSSDGTVDILKRSAAQFSHLRWISEPDDGQSDAMNKGISLAQGRVLGFLNVDDFYEPGLLSRIHELFSKQLKREPVLVVGNCNVWGDDQRLLYVNRPSKLHITDLLLGWNYAQYPVNPSAYFYHKSIHDRVGGYVVADHHAMDLDFLLRAVQVSKVLYRDEVWGNYRYIAGTKTFDDVSKGDAKARVQRLLDQYRLSLPGWQRVQLKIKRKMWHREQRRRRSSQAAHAGG